MHMKQPQDPSRNHRECKWIWHLWELSKVCPKIRPWKQWKFMFEFRLESCSTLVALYSIYLAKTIFPFLGTVARLFQPVCAGSFGSRSSCGSLLTGQHGPRWASPGSPLLQQCCTDILTHSWAPIHPQTFSYQINSLSLNWSPTFCSRERSWVCTLHLTLLIIKKILGI